MLDRHAVQELLRAGVRTRAVARQFRVSRRTIERIAREGRITSGEDGVIRAEPVEVGLRGSVRDIGRPRVSEELKDRVRGLVIEDPERPAGEIARLLRDEGTPLGLSTVYRVLASVKSAIPAALQVRFEGVAGEYAQFDFGEVSVRLTDGSRRTVHFAAYRLKYSRWVHVEIVPNEKVEALVRSLLASFEASGGVPLRVVFDNPKTVVVRHEEGRPVWNAVLAPVAIDYGFTIELCTPRQPQQKGSVENLVGFVKRSFFRARRFADLTIDLAEQLSQWLVDVNTVRPSRATKEIPAVRLIAEQARMKSLAITPGEYGLRFSVTVGPTAMVTHQGIRYAMPARACGLPATLWLYPDRVKIVTAGSRHEAIHPRFPEHGGISYLPGQRAAQLASVAGERKRVYFMRERILELGAVGEGYLTELIHQRPFTWKGDVERLFALLEELGDTHFRMVLQRALFQQLIGADHLVRLAARISGPETEGTEAVS
ncbi:MAG TPA: IS21 family transposase [Gemmatimonadaceae bacterium]|nr:IS21 family transposase [Gemmatimonadaceae bacterium]